MAPGKADDLAWYRLATSLDGQPGANRHRMDRAGDLDHQSAYLHDAAEYLDTFDIADFFSESFHEEGPSLQARIPSGPKSPSTPKGPLRLTAGVVPLTWCLPGSLIIGSFVHGT